MAEFKVVISDPKTGKSKQIQLNESNSKPLIGKKLKETIKGETIDMPGYEFTITGGSDFAGFPMRSDVPGQNRKKILSGKSVGIKTLRNKYNRIRKTVCGNTIHAKIAQINIKIVKAGPKPLFEEGEKPAEKKDEKKK
jgi:small subunit ribosomal protein S6e